MNIFLVLKILMKTDIIGNKKKNFMIDEEKIKEQKELIKCIEEGKLDEWLNKKNYKSKFDNLSEKEFNKIVNVLIDIVDKIEVPIKGNKNIDKTDISETSFDYA